MRNFATSFLENNNVLLVDKLNENSIQNFISLTRISWVPEFQYKRKYARESAFNREDKWLQVNMAE